MYTVAPLATKVVAIIRPIPCIIRLGMHDEKKIESKVHDQSKQHSPFPLQ